MKTRIAAWATVTGESEVPLAELARAHQTSDAAIRRSLGGARVYSSSRSCAELALEASNAALARAGVEASALSLVACIGSRALRLQHELSAHRAWALSTGQNCAAIAEALQLVDSLLRTNPALDIALIATAEKWAFSEQRTVGRIDESTMRDIFSDGASAFVVRRGVEGCELIGFGAATSGAHWDYWPRVTQGQPPHDDLVVMGDCLSLLRDAFECSLSSAQIDRSAIDWLLFPNEGARLPYAFARAIGMPLTKLFVPEGAPSHIGGADVAVSLDALFKRGATSGQIVSVCARSIDDVRFAQLRL